MRFFGVVIFLALVAVYLSTGGSKIIQPTADADPGSQTIVARQPVEQSPALKAAIKEQALRDVAAYSVKVERMTWSADYGVMIASFTFSNPTDFDMKDMVVTCDLSAPSGTKISTAERTVYEIVPARSQKTVSRINMGFVNSQAKKAGCVVNRAISTMYRPNPKKDQANSATAK